MKNLINHCERKNVKSKWWWFNIIFRWKSLIYWGTSLPNAKYNNLENLSKQNNKQVLLHGTVDLNTFNNISDDWVKVEVAACGK